MNPKKVVLNGFKSFVILGGLLWYSSQTTNDFSPFCVQKSCTEKAIFELSGDEYISSVIAKSKYPFTLAAIAKQESDFRPLIRGDHGKSKGLFQIQSQHWGFVPDSVEGQTEKAQGILDELVARHGLSKAIERYNGSGQDARVYRKKILSIVHELEEKKARIARYEVQQRTAKQA